MAPGPAEELGTVWALSRVASSFSNSQHCPKFCPSLPTNPRRRPHQPADYGREVMPLTCTVLPYILKSTKNIELARFRHKGLKQLYEDGHAKGVPPAVTDKLRKLLFALESADGLDQISRFPGWKLHPLKGDLKGFWSLAVTGN